MSWDEAFADRYEEWSADMTADVAFYAGLACSADGPFTDDSQEYVFVVRR
jgi:hypothetical protein